MITLLNMPQPKTKKRVLEFAVDNFVGHFMFRRGWAAVTLPLPFVVLIFYWIGEDNGLNERPRSLARLPYVRVHEFVHVAQEARYKTCFHFWWAYLSELRRNGYHNNAFELEADLAEDQAYRDGLEGWPKA